MKNTPIFRRPFYSEINVIPTKPRIIDKPDPQNAYKKFNIRIHNTTKYNVRLQVHKLSLLPSALYASDHGTVRE